MLYRKENKDGDMVFGNGRNAYEINTPLGVALLVKNRVALWWKEWFMDTNEGTPIPTGKITQEEADAIILDRIRTSYGVKSIVSYQSTLEKRTMTYTVTIDTIYGDFSLEEDIVWL